VATAARSDGGGFVVSAPLQNVEKVIDDLSIHAIRTPLSRIPALRGIETSCPAMRFPDRAHFR